MCQHTSSRSKPIPPESPPPPALLSLEQRTAIAAALPLTPRQTQIMVLLLAATQQKQIAADLDLSPHTVRAYRRQIFARLHVENSMELILAAFAHYMHHQKAANEHCAGIALKGDALGGDVQEGVLPR